MVLIAVQLKHMLNTCTAGRVIHIYMLSAFFKFKLTIILAFMLSYLKIELMHKKCHSNIHVLYWNSHQCDITFICVVNMYNSHHTVYQL